MKLIENWKAVATKSHSMWAFYLSFICLIAPEAIYALSERDTNPRIWWFAGVLLLVFGIGGRVRDQGIDRGKARSSALVTLLAILLLSSVQIGAPDRADAAGYERSTEQSFLKVAIPFVGKWEGLRLTAYRDVVGIWTVCYGETKGVKAGDRYTKAECDAMFGGRLVEFRNGLHRYFTDDTKKNRLPVLRDVAYVSLAYNAGIRAAGKSTATRRLNAGDIRGGCEALTWWNKAGGRVIRGLVNRRTEERAMCLKGAA